MKQGSIAVVMSVYKAEEPVFFDESLKSVWTDQTLKPQQIIIVQDGELPEELQQVLMQWKNKLGNTMTILVNEQNLGLTKCLNIGISHVRTKYIARMDSDDVSLPERFAKQYAYLEEHPETDVVGATAMEIDADGHELFLRHYPLSDKAVRATIHKATPLQHSLVMMRTEPFRSGRVAYDERFRLTQDLALWFDMLCAGLKIENLDDTLLLFRLTGGSFKRRDKVKANNEFKIYMYGIYRLYGFFSWRYVYPISRYIYRRLPTSMVKIIFNSSLRRKLLDAKDRNNK